MPGAPHWSTVIDPTEVTRIALQNAASIASVMLTTGAMVDEIPEKKLARPRWLRPEGKELLNLTRFPAIKGAAERGA